jgi:hypothetical protein
LQIRHSGRLEPSGNEYYCLCECGKRQGRHAIDYGGPKGTNRDLQGVAGTGGGNVQQVVTASGTTAVLQAAHFGHLEVLRVFVFEHHSRSLLELANFNHTTRLMRASQEGHIPVVEYLVQRGALLNRKNRERMTALMLAGQRGHSQFCLYLVTHGADLDAMTSQ